MTIPALERAKSGPRQWPDFSETPLGRCRVTSLRQILQQLPHQLIEPADGSDVDPLVR